MEHLIRRITDREWKIKLLLLLSGFLIYFIYFHHVLLHANTILAGITGDALKNYYTFMFHSLHDKQLLHFSGMNYPFGEHIVYTDCQPLLTFIFRPLHFLHPHLIGILHWLLFLSYIVTPVIIYNILRTYISGKAPLFFFALGITLLSPQFAKIVGGHHGLAYGCVIPAAILLLIRLLRNHSGRSLVALTLFNFLLFLIHPYLGFNSTVFSFLTLCFYGITKKEKKKPLRFLEALIAGVLPLAAFRLLMTLTDDHKNRTEEPFGKNTLVENIDSLLAPDFGPFRSLMENLFPDKTTHLESHSYLGFFTILMLLMSSAILLLRFRRSRFDAGLSALLVSALFLLLFSFGLHHTLLSALNVDFPALNQFRATSRFAWSFYYSLPIFLVIFLWENFFSGIRSYFFTATALLFFIFHLLEAHDHYSTQAHNFWKDRNVFRREQLAKEELDIIEQIRTHDPQAIVTLPVFHVGSEMYGRTGADVSMIPAFLYSFHTQKPILGTFMSRTSISETEDLLSLLNSYKRNQPALLKMNDKDLFVIKTNDQFWPDEERLASVLTAEKKTRDYEAGFISVSQLRQRKVTSRTLHELSGSDSLVYIRTRESPPFTETNMNSEISIQKVSSDTLKPGPYMLSFHYYFSGKGQFKPETLHLLILKKENGEERWHQLQAVRVLSGYYKEFGVFEYPLSIQPGDDLNIALKGMSDQTYYIRNFMLRPAGLTTYEICDQDTLINNFPVNAP